MDYLELDVIRSACDVSLNSRRNSRVGGEADCEVAAADMATERNSREFL